MLWNLSFTTVDFWPGFKFYGHKGGTVDLYLTERNAIGKSLTNMKK